MIDRRTVNDLLVEWADRPELKPGFSWGDDLSWQDVKAGDEFQTQGDQRMASTGGEVTKVNRKNLTYKIIYMSKREMTLTIERNQLIGGYIFRGKKVHRII